MENVARLTLDEPVSVDGLRLDDIVRDLGESAAGEVIGLALEQLAVTMRRMRHAALTGDWPAVRDDAEYLARLAWQVGLISLASVALDVAACVTRGDAAGQAATLGRLQRIGRRSLTELWDHADLVPPDTG